MDKCFLSPTEASSQPPRDATPPSHQAQLAALQEVVNNQAQQIHELTQRCLALSGTLDSLPRPVLPEYQPRRKPMGSPFNGNKSKFVAWRSLMSHKLVADAAFIGDAHNQWDFIFQNLSTKVQGQVAPYFKSGASVDYNPTEFLNYLSSIYADPYQEDIALTELDYIEQRANEPFADFFVRFENKMALAGAMYWPDAVQLAKLRRALNKQMRDLIIGRDVSRTAYYPAIERLRSIAVDIELLRLEKKYRNRRGRG
ncbi:uncharacterized protein MAM_02286 [Metarhizium album ARSEF 1941]|uniref:Retrotransposon gag domain-containing protein n=1 Tax=Metarhizium album (strain ARSEF 1941) TaxID=1081103 RepID=A0A0B2X3P9_METAS|nr:uncharacterized protein MAM_02286 [Metarhizium album ARSEF 1941]KHO00363.1 hypothetical protein MAM_02286 [Metarhizium album ARSEF 1941]